MSSALSCVVRRRSDQTEAGSSPPRKACFAHRVSHGCQVCTTKGVIDAFLTGIEVGKTDADRTRRPGTGGDLAIAGDIAAHAFEDLRGVPCVFPGEEGEEFLAAGPSNQDTLFLMAAQRVNDRAQGHIPLAMPQFVIDRLELIDVDDRDGKAGVGHVGLFSRRCRDLEELAPIIGIGERIALRGGCQAGLKLLAFGDVEHQSSKTAQASVSGGHTGLVQHDVPHAGFRHADIRFNADHTTFSHDFEIGLPVHLCDVLGQKSGESLPDHAVVLGADELAESRVATEIAAADVLEIDRRGQVIEAVLPGVQSVLQDSALLLVALDQSEMTLGTQKTAQQVMGPLLQEQVVGARLEQFGLKLHPHSFWHGDHID